MANGVYKPGIDSNWNRRISHKSRPPEVLFLQVAMQMSLTWAYLLDRRDPRDRFIMEYMGYTLW
jgi:hypothetical protein